MARIYATRKLPGGALEKLAEEGHDLAVWEGFCAPPRPRLLEEVRGANALVTLLDDRVDAELMDAAGSGLKVIAQYAVGVDNIDLKAARERGIVVTHTPGVLADATADLAMALLLAAARHVVEGMEEVRAGGWRCWNPGYLLGKDLNGATLLVVGFGEIGQRLARRAKGFGLELLYTSRRRKPEAEAALGARFVSLDEGLELADFVSLHVPLTPETYRLLDAHRLARMKPGSVLVNTARGAVVDTSALVEALREGPLFAAGLDVTDPEPLPPDHPLLALKNVVITPHIGSAGMNTRTRMAEIVAENVRRVLAGRPPLTPVRPPPAQP